MDIWLIMMCVDFFGIVNCSWYSTAPLFLTSEPFHGFAERGGQRTCLESSVVAAGPLVLRVTIAPMYAGPFRWSILQFSTPQ